MKKTILFEIRDLTKGQTITKKDKAVGVVVSTGHTLFNKLYYVAVKWMKYEHVNERVRIYTKKYFFTPWENTKVKEI